MSISGIYGLLQNIGNAIANISNNVGNVVSGNAQFLSSLVNGLRQDLGGRLQELGDRLNQISGGLTGGITSSLLNSLSTLSSTLGTLTSGLSSGLSDIRGRIDNVISSVSSTVGDTLRTKLSELYQWLDNTTSGIYRSLDQQSGNIFRTLDDATKSIYSGLNANARVVEDNTRELSSQIQSGINELGGRLNSLSQDLSGFTQSLPSALSQSISDAFESLSKTLDPTKISDYFLDELYRRLGSIPQALSAKTSQKQAIAEKLISTGYDNPIDFARALTDPEPPRNIITAIIDGLYAFVGYILIAREVASIYAREAIQNANQRNQNEILSPETIASLWARNIIAQDFAERESARSGINPLRLSLFQQLAKQSLALSTIFEMWNRGLIDEREAESLLRDAAYRDNQIPYLKQLRFSIPPLQDLIRFAVRESFNDSISAKYGYDSEYPAALEKYIEFLGVDREWLKRYWRAHWELPSVSQVFDMLHRNKETGVTIDDVREFLKVADISPNWRDKLIAISYAPYTRVDVRRMYKLGVLDYEGVKRAYLDLGYNNERAEKLAQFTVKYEDATGESDKDALERKEYNELLKLFVSGKRTEEDLRNFMHQSNWDNDLIEAELRIARLRKENKVRVDNLESNLLSESSLQRERINVLESLYATGHAELSELEQALDEAGVGQRERTLELEIATLKRRAHYEPPAFDKVRELVSSQILDSVTLGTISSDEGLRMLIELGYSEQSARLLLVNEQMKNQARFKREISSLVEQAFLASQINETDATALLIRFNFTQSEIEQSLAIWSVRKQLRRRNFTESQLASMLRRGIISINEYAKEMQALGWSDEQIQRFIKLRGGE